MKLKNIFLFASTVVLGMGMTSCADDDLGASIFDTNDYPLDRSLYTFPLDTFAKKNFLEPFNLKYIYKMEDIGSDLQKNLTPAAYDKAVDLAVLSKYLWYDVYSKLAGDKEVFLKLYSPRIIHVIGSASYNTSSGSETLGTAEGGLKITLYKVNSLNVNNIDFMNEYFFGTMHHEFSHILNQTYERPTAFNTISNGKYDMSSWTEKRDSVVLAQGFVTPYASSQIREDWVEVIAQYITRDPLRWERMLDAATYDWEDLDNIDEEWFNKLITPGCNRDTIGYSYKTEGGTFKVYRKLVARNAAGYVELDKDGNIQYLKESGINGKEIILKKLDMAREWLKTNFNIDIDKVRQEVQSRQYVTNPDGTFKLDENGQLINKLTSPTVSNPNVTLIDSLRNQVYSFKELQNK